MIAYIYFYIVDAFNFKNIVSYILCYFKSKYCWTEWTCKM